MIKTPNLLILIAACLLCACKNTSSFKVEGTIDGGTTTNLRIVYAGDDVLNNVITAARDGKFTFEGRTPRDGALVQVLSYEYTPLGIFFAQNGNKIKLTIKGNTLTATGNEVNDRLGVWQKDNASLLASGNATKINAAIAKYVKANASDPVSAILLVSYYDAAIDPAGARTLLETLTPEARPVGLVDGMAMEVERVSDTKSLGKVTEIQYITVADTLTTFRPKAHKKSLLAFDAGERMREDSVIDGLRAAHHDGAYVLEFSTATDTFAWRSGIRRDSTRWHHAWMPGGIGARGIDRLGIARLPFYIALDATGRQLYRGPSLTAARNALR